MELAGRKKLAVITMCHILSFFVLLLAVKWPKFEHYM